MNKKFLLAASMVLACACQPKQPTQQNTQQDKQQEEKSAPSGGCCKTEKSQTAPLSEPVKAQAPAPASAPQQQSPVTSAAPEAKIEHKAP